MLGGGDLFQERSLMLGEAHLKKAIANHGERQYAILAPWLESNGLVCRCYSVLVVDALPPRQIS
jgi:hypothetical protein